MDARDWIALVGLLMLAGGLYLVFPPASLITPGVVLTWYALVALRAPSNLPTPTSRHTNVETDPD